MTGIQACPPGPSPMFFWLSKILWALILPFQLFLVLVFVLWRGAPPSKFRRFFALFLALLVLLSTTWGSSLLIRILEDHYPYVEIADAPKADAVIVLSGMVNPLAGPGKRTEFLGSLDRLLAGADLVRGGRASVLLISGGSGLLSQAGEPEADILKRWLTDHGMDGRKIIAESRSRNTAENAAESAAIIRQSGWKNVLLVTSAFHMPRSVLCFRRQGIDVHPFPVDYYAARTWPGIEALFPNESALGTSTTAIREFVGLAAYKLRGYL